MNNFYGNRNNIFLVLSGRSVSYRGIEHTSYNVDPSHRAPHSGDLSRWAALQIQSRGSHWPEDHRHVILRKRLVAACLATSLRCFARRRAEAIRNNRKTRRDSAIVGGNSNWFGPGRLNRAKRVSTRICRRWASRPSGLPRSVVPLRPPLTDGFGLHTEVAATL